MTSFYYNYQNALRQAIVFSIFSFVKNRSCVTQIYRCSEMHSGSCSQKTSSCKCPIMMWCGVMWWRHFAWHDVAWREIVCHARNGEEKPQHVPKGKKNRCVSRGWSCPGGVDVGAHRPTAQGLCLFVYLFIYLFTCWFAWFALLLPCPFFVNIFIVCLNNRRKQYLRTDRLTD